MPAIAFYMIKIILCSGILFGYYWLALRNKIFHQYNRFYLLVSLAVSLLLPLIQINIWHSSTAAPSSSIQLLKVVSGGNDLLDEIIITSNKNLLSTTDLFQLCYWLVSFVMMLLFIQSLLRIYRLYVQNEHSSVEQIHLINTTAKEAPFSFLKYIFWNSHIDINSTTGTQIFKHELAHVRQKHSHDKLFINIILIVCWCNPFYWLIRKELNMIHEFIADKKAVEDSDTAAFANMILQATYPQHQFALTNQFFYSPIKRRLTMLKKNNNTKAGYIGRVLVLPLLLLTFAAFSFKTKTIYGDNSNLYKGKPLTIVINAGHGGKDFGAAAASGELEKDIVLAIAKKIKVLNQNKNFQIILSRETDEYISVKDVVDNTDKANADLFISIHVDAEKEINTKSGMTVWIPKNDFEKIEESKILGNSILTAFRNNPGLFLYDNLNQVEKNIWVLKANKCPSVLIETGFMNNEKDVAFLTSEKNQEQIARNILNAIENYAANSKASSTVFAETPNNHLIATDSQPPIASFTIKKIVVQRDKQDKEATVSSMSGNVSLEKKDTEKMLVIINGKKITNEELKNKTIESKFARMYSANNKEAIEKYGTDAINGVIEFESASITKNIDANKNGTIINVDSAVIIGVDVVKNEQPSVKMNPIYVVDGIVTSAKTANGIDPQSIDRMNVLKGKEAANKYGAKGKDGVVEIITKQNISTIRKKETADTLNPIDEPVFAKVENEASFPGGNQAWIKYLMSNIDAGVPVNEGWKPGKYQVMIKFIVDKNGNVSDVKTDNYQGTKTAAQCINLIKNGPKWQPAVQNGRKVNAYRKQPITFVVDAQ